MSTHTITRQVPINNTVQVSVGPGDETGLYYILIGNLPWQTSWQQVKDHVRTVCSAVERVEIFNESTCGWVCVRGRENFKAAMQLLMTRPLGDRPIFVDGRNATEEIPIKKLVGTAEMLLASPRSPRTPRTTPQMMQYPMTTPPMMPSLSTSEYHQWSSGVPVSSSTAYGMQPMAIGMSSNYCDSGSWCSTYDSGYADNSSILPASMHSYPAETAYHYSQTGDYYENNYTGVQAQPTTTQVSTSTTTKRPKKSQDGSQKLVEIEFRKIIVKGLSDWVQQEQIKGLLRSRCGFSGSEVSSIKIPQSKDGGNRGHATIVFASASYAARAIEKLNKHKFDGKPLNVDYTAEGVSKDEDSRQKHHRSHKHHHHHQHREDKDKKESSSKPSISGQEKKGKPVKKEVIIANGSSSRTV